MTDLFKKGWFRWLLAYVSFGLLAGLVYFVLVVREAESDGTSETISAATIVLAAAATIEVAWMYLGLFWLRQRPWAKWLAIALAISNAVWLISLWLYATGRMEPYTALLGTWTLVAVAIASTHLLRLIVAGPHPVIGIARTVIIQATRMHLITVVAVIVAAALMFVPSWIDESERLNYRVSFYIGNALRLCTTCVGLLTCLLACWTICYDQSRSQMYMIATKPVSRFAYLLGKLLGMVALNTVMVVIIGIGLWAGARSLGSRPSDPDDPKAHEDYLITHHEVLTSRLTAYPSPPDEKQTRAAIEQRFEELRQLNPKEMPEKFADLSEKEYGEIAGHALAKWHTIAAGSSQSYLFQNLQFLHEEFKALSAQFEKLKPQFEELVKSGQHDEARKLLQRVQAMQQNRSALRLRFKAKYATAPKDELMRLKLGINGPTIPLAAYPNNTVREEAIPIYVVDADGKLLVTIENPNLVFPDGTRTSSIQFAPRKDLELVYTYGSFEGNVFRCLFVTWVQMLFLAAVGLSAGTLLGFPMACVGTLMIYAVAALNASFTEAVDFYGGIDIKNKARWDMIVEVLNKTWENLISGDFGGFFQLCIKLVGELALLLMPSFSPVSAIDQIADGRLVTGALMWDTSWRLGLWSVVFIFVGWLILRRLEPARVTV